MATAAVLTLGLGSWRLFQPDGAVEVDAAGPVSTTEGAAAAEDPISDPSDDSAEDPQAESPSSSETRPESSAESAAVCSVDLPFEASLGVAGGTVSDQSTTTPDGVIVRRIEHSTGASLELTWPASPKQLYAIETEQPDGDYWWGSKPELDYLALSVFEGFDGDSSVVPGIRVEPTDDWDRRAEEPGCDSVEITVGQDDQELLRLAWTPGDDEPREWGALVATSEEVSVGPAAALTCSDASVPSEGSDQPAIDLSLDPAPSPAEALLAFLDAEERRLFQVGYHEMKVDDGHYVYGAPLDSEPGPITSASRFVTLVSVEQTDDGWLASSWESSGC